MPQFRQARLKIEWADQHIRQVKHRVDAVVSPDSQTSTIDVDPKTGNKIICYRLNKWRDLPYIALVIGDAIHNLRTALDYSWLEIIRKLVPKAAGNYSKFPIFPTVDGVKGALTGHAIHILSPKLFELMLSEIKPYDGGDFSLYPMHRMDITDKHKLLIPTAHHGNISGLKLKDHKRERTGVHFISDELAETITITVGRGLTIENKGHLAFQIVFKEGPVRFMQVSDVLEMFSIKVLRTVERLEKFIME